MSVRYVDAAREHVRFLAPRLRTADIREVYASAGLTPEGALLSSMLGSDMAWTAMVGEEPIAMLGVGSGPTPDFAIPWLLGTDRVRRHPKAIVRDGREFTSMWSAMYGTLANAVHSEHQESMRWLEALGFERIDTLDNYGVVGDTFYLYALNV